MINVVEKIVNELTCLLVNCYCIATNKFIKSDNELHTFKFKEGIVIRFDRQRFPGYIVSNKTDPPIEFVDIMIKGIKEINSETLLNKYEIEGYCLTTNATIHFTSDMIYFRKTFGFYMRTSDQLNFFPRYTVKEIIE